MTAPGPPGTELPDAAPGAPGAVLVPWDGDALPPGGVLVAALRWAWDGIYMITDTGRGILVVRAADGGSFTASDPLAARDEILADFSRKGPEDAP